MNVHRHIEVLAEVANKYKTLASFKKHSPEAYQTAKQLAVLGTICKHMK